MNEYQDPFGRLFDQLTDLLRRLQEKSNTPLDESVLTPAIQKKLKKIGKKVKIFEQLSADIVAMSEVSQEELLKRLQGTSSDLPDHGKQLLEKGRRLQSDLNTLKNTMPANAQEGVSLQPTSNLSLPKGTSKSDFEKTKEMSSDKFGRKRKRKFKSFGDGHI